MDYRKFKPATGRAHVSRFTLPITTMQHERVRIRIMRQPAPDPLPQERADVNHLPAKPVFSEDLLHPFHAEHIPMVILDRPQDMLRDFVHVEKAHRNAPAGCLLYTSPSPRDRQKS